MQIYGFTERRDEHEGEKQGHIFEELNDDDLADVNGGVDISPVSADSVCINFYLAAGMVNSRKCENCFYFHYENGASYCSHPHFGKK